MDACASYDTSTTCPLRAFRRVHLSIRLTGDARRLTGHARRLTDNVGVTARRRYRPFGESAVLVELDDLRQVLALDRALRRNAPGWVSDLIPAARTLLVRFDADVVTAQDVSSWVDAAEPTGTTAGPVAPTVEIPVRYDGPDLAEVAGLTGLTVDEVIARHTGAQFVVAFCGFAPGFAYLTGVPAALRVPRRPSPRTAVPAGAVALADEFSAVYPRASPGGWQLIGSTTLPMFDLDREPAVLLAPGIPVRFVRIPG